MIVYQAHISRRDLQANPKVLYVFGDNVKRVGFGGQAQEMRGEPNAVGVATKWAPGYEEEDFFSDDQFPDCAAIIRADWRPAYEHSNAGGVVIVPLDGIGTGLSQLPERAPRLYRSLCGMGLGAQPRLTDSERVRRNPRTTGFGMYLGRHEEEV